jgi:uncharacterized protein (DUF2062 family)
LIFDREAVGRNELWFFALQDVCQDGVSPGRGVMQGNNRMRKQNNRLAGVGRWFRYRYFQLFRVKGGPAKVAKGFSVGLAVEMFTLPTFGLAFFLIFPFVFFLRASFAGALAGFVFGKIIYIPLAFLNAKVGGWIVPKHFYRTLHMMLPHWLDDILRVSFKLIVGGMVVGTVLGLLAYFPLKWALEAFASRRKEKRRHRKAQLVISKQEP